MSDQLCPLPAIIRPPRGEGQSNSGVCCMAQVGDIAIVGFGADSKSFSLKATVGDETYGVLSNKYLAAAARTVLFTMDVTIGDGEYSYDETTVYDLARTNSRIEHTDHNTLHRID